MRLKTKFQDEDFELGEVVNAKISDLTCYEDDKRIKISASAKKGGEHTFFYSSIAEFLEMWEDAPEEPKEYWFIDIRYPKVEPKKDINLSNSMRKRLKEIGNYFETEEEAKRAVEKLKALKRLRDKGFRFTNYSGEDREYIHQLEIYAESDPFFDGKPVDLMEDPNVKLLFGNEE